LSERLLHALFAPVRSLPGWVASAVVGKTPCRFCMHSTYSLVGFWADKPGWCWFVVRGKHYWLADKPWLKPTSEHADCLLGRQVAKVKWKLHGWMDGRMDWWMGIWAGRLRICLSSFLLLLLFYSACNNPEKRIVVANNIRSTLQK